MKRVVAGQEPAVLAVFRTAEPSGTWEQFKSQQGSGGVFDHLVAVQGYLCAYCEIRVERPPLGLPRGQVEHFEPKSASTPDRNLDLEFTNLLACCEGGANPWMEGRAEKPIANTMHCGQLKAERSPVGCMLDPRAIPTSPCLWRTSSRGELSVDRDACSAMGVDPDIAESTLTFLGLNRPVLVRLRSAIVTDLDRTLEEIVDNGDVSQRVLLVASEILLPDSSGQLSEFWSTIRAWAGPAIEPFIDANAHRIPGLA